MPINPSALSSPDPDESAQERQDIARHVAEQQQREEQEQPKRQRRSKAQMIADAVVPDFDDKVEVKDVATGAKIERPWRVAVELFREKKVDWPDNVLKYAFMKYEQERATQVGGAFAQSQEGQAVADEARENNRQAELESLGQAPATGEIGVHVVPPDAELGDEVVFGKDVYVVGHGGVLVQGMIEKDGVPVIPQRRWQRELGAGPDGAWESRALSQPDGEKSSAFSGAAESVAEALTRQAADDQRAHDALPPEVQAERLPREVEQVNDYTWKVGNGILEKIGLPDYSSLQVGPISASRMVVDDGRRIRVELSGGRTAEVPAAIVEAFEEIDNTVEFIAKRFRGQLMTFLESTGALKQPVS